MTQHSDERRGKITFFNNQPVDAVTAPIKTRAKEMTYQASGLAGGETAQFEFSLDNVFDTDLYPGGVDDANWSAHPDGIITENKVDNVRIGECYIRARLVGAVGGTLFNLKTVPIE